MTRRHNHNHHNHDSPCAPAACPPASAAARVALLLLEVMASMPTMASGVATTVALSSWKATTTFLAWALLEVTKALTSILSS